MDIGKIIGETHVGSTMKALNPARTPQHIQFSIPHHLLNPPSVEEINAFQSANAIVKRLSQVITDWNERLPTDKEAAIIAILPGGIEVNVLELSAEGYEGITIRGIWKGGEVLVTMHKSNFITMCMEISTDEDKPRREIGFHFQG